MFSPHLNVCSLLIECVDGTGTLEWNTVNDTLVKMHTIVGVVTGAPADDMIFIGNSGNSVAVMVKPGGEFPFKISRRGGRGRILICCFHNADFIVGCDQ
jgi:hypothetical protein